jgi:murein DD-endopeptidase MepM/ murein hydrolase activator NlpD
MFRRSSLRREIPQKVDAQFSPTEQNRSDSAARFGATLFRRTRSASLLSVTLSASTLGAMMPQQKVEAFAPSNLLGAVSLPGLVNSANFQASAIPELLTQTNQQPNTALAPIQANVWKSQDGSNRLEPVFSTNSQIRSALQPSGQESEETILSSLALSADRQSSPSLSITANDDSSLLSQNELTKVLEADVAQPSAANSGNLDSSKPTALVHKVQKGENLSQIAEKYKVSPESIAQSNKISNPDVIEANQDLVVPSASISAAAAPLILGSWADNTRVLSQAISQMGIASALLTPQQSLKPEQANNTQPISQPVSQLEPVSAKLLTEKAAPQAYWQETPKSTSGPLALNLRPDGISNSYGSGMTNSVVIARRSTFPQLPALELPSLSSSEQFLPSSMQNGSQKYIWPAKGTFTSAYGWRWGRMHRGIDVAGPVGTPIVAAAGGVVIKAGWNDGGYGYLVEIQHPDGSLTRYGHNSSINTRVGAVVQQGELIALMGSTGRSTGPHCHFEIHPNGQRAVDPMMFLSRS